MIKLKEILDGGWAGGMFDYEAYTQLPPDEKINMATAFFTSPHAKRLTGAEVFHIILSLPKSNIRAIYNMAQHHLTPEQLADTKQQIDAFHR